MRYALIFAGVAAAYDAYGYDGYGDKVSSSTPAVNKSSATPAYEGYGDNDKTTSMASSKPTPVGYTTIYPNYGKEPVTVTSQYQPYPTCAAAGSDGKSCDKWNEDKYVSTVINDCDSKKITVTHVEKPITVYHTKTTITHYPTASSAGGRDGKAYPTGSYGYDEKKNGTNTWYEMYEKVHEVKYKDLGAHGLPGYGGSGLCKTCNDEQPYKVKEYKDGKWSEYETKAVYKAPVPETKTYEKPGIYTESAQDMTVTYTITKPSEATTTAKAGIPVTYGGVTTEFKETGIQTCAYGAYETGKDEDGKDVTSTVVKTVTATVSTTGKYEVAQPTTTVYDKDTEVKYPTVSIYKPGVYHKDAQTITITKSGDSVSCEYSQTKTYPSEPEKTPVYDDEYSHGGSFSSVPVKNVSSTEYKSNYPDSTPSAANSSSKPDDKYPITSTAPYYPVSTPVNETGKSSSTSCSSSIKPNAETETKSSEYPSYPTSTVSSHENEYLPYDSQSSSISSVDSKTSLVEHPSYATSSVLSYDGESSSMGYPSYPTPSSASYYPATTTVPHYESGSSTPCPSSTKPVVEGEKSSSIAYPEYPVVSSSAPSYPATTTVAHYESGSSTPCPSSTKPVDDNNNNNNNKSSSTAYPEYAVASSSAPSYDDEKSSSTEYPSYSATTTVPHYENGSSTPCPSSTKPIGKGEKSSSTAYPEYPVASSSAPVYEAYPTATPAKYTDNKPSYDAVPSQTTAGYPNPSGYYGENNVNIYGAGESYGYSKRAGVVQRRKAAIAKRSNNAVVA